MTTRIIKTLRDNFSTLIDIVTALAALYVVLRNEANPLDPAQFNSLILAVLALMAISGVAERLVQINRIRDNSETILSLLSDLPKPGEREAFLKTYDQLAPLAERLRGTNTIWISGRTLSSMIGIYRDLFRHKIVEDNCEIRILIVEPDGDVARAETLQHHNEGSLQNCATKARSTIASLEVLRRDVGDRSCNLEVRRLDYAPRFGLMITDPESNEGVVQVQLLSHWRTSWGRPIFRIMRNENTRWFNEFVLQFSELWGAATSLWETTNHDDEPASEQLTEQVDWDEEHQN